MAKKPLPCPTVLRQLLRYEPETGKLFWRERKPFWFRGMKRSELTICLAWNVKYAGKEAMTYTTSYGYLSGAVFEHGLQSHRVIWAIFYGRWPKDQIDHINGNRTDNRIENLREVSSLRNNQNMKRSSLNTSGFTGVSWCRATSKWRASIRVNKKSVSLGYYEKKKDAIKARIAGNAEYGFHPNHGRF